LFHTTPWLHRHVVVADEVLRFVSLGSTCSALHCTGLVEEAGCGEWKGP
jgi:hypothetical protein